MLCLATCKCMCVIFHMGILTITSPTIISNKPWLIKTKLKVHPSANVFLCLFKSCLFVWTYSWWNYIQIPIWIFGPSAFWLDVDRPEHTLAFGKRLTAIRPGCQLGTWRGAGRPQDLQGKTADRPRVHRTPAQNALNYLKLIEITFTNTNTSVI